MKKNKVKKTRKNLFKILREFFKSVIKEGKKVIWTTKKELIKYSLATLAFMLFICLFFITTDLVIALFSFLKELIG